MHSVAVAVCELVSRRFFTASPSHKRAYIWNDKGRRLVSELPWPKNFTQKFPNTAFLWFISKLSQLFNSYLFTLKQKPCVRMRKFKRGIIWGKTLWDSQKLAKTTRNSSSVRHGYFRKQLTTRASSESVYHASWRTILAMPLHYANERLLSVHLDLHLRIWRHKIYLRGKCSYAIHSETVLRHILSLFYGLI